MGKKENGEGSEGEERQRERRDSWPIPNNLHFLRRGWKGKGGEEGVWKGRMNGRRREGERK